MRTCRLRRFKNNKDPEMTVVQYSIYNKLARGQYERCTNCVGLESRIPYERTENLLEDYVWAEEGNIVE